MRRGCSVLAALTFLAPEESEGGRVRVWSRLRVHLVVGDPAQREALYDANGVSGESYLGVQFAGGGEFLAPGTEHEIRMELSFSDQVDYSALTPGATFTVRDGPHVIGFGKVLESPFG